MTNLQRLQLTGIRRLGSPKRGFRYRPQSGRLTKADLDRIRALKIPPAWTDVAINPATKGRLQAVGKDAAGRWQYLYHSDHTKLQEIRKFKRLAKFAKALPKLRAAGGARPSLGPTSATGGAVLGLGDDAPGILDELCRERACDDPDREALRRRIHAIVDQNDVGVSCEQAVVRLEDALTPVVAAFNSGSITAAAYAGLGSAICKVPPLMICNPNPGTPFPVTPGVGVKVVAHQNGQSWSAGNFGFLNVGQSNNGAPDLLGAMAYQDASLTCQDVDTGDVDTGATVPASSGTRASGDGHAWSRFLTITQRT